MQKVSVGTFKETDGSLSIKQFFQFVSTLALGVGICAVILAVCIHVVDNENRQESAELEHEDDTDYDLSKDLQKILLKNVPL